MKLIKNQKGYTITETLIVLAVTGVMFITTSILIQGQVEKNRYKDSMRQIQQLVQQAIRDTENGYFPGVSGTTTGTVLAGKSIYFSTDASVANDDGNSRQPCTAGSNTIRVENIYWNPTIATNPSPDTDGVGTPSFDTDIELNTGRASFSPYPAGVLYSKNYKSDGSVKSSSAGFAVMFKNLSDTSDTMQSIALYEPYIDNNNVVTNNQDDWTYGANGKRICFKGYKNGSLIIGRNNSMNVEMNLEDVACN